MKKGFLLILMALMIQSAQALHPVKLSQEFLYAVRLGEPTDSLVQQLANYPFDRLLLELNADSLKYAFWINIYNGFVQKLLSTNPDQFKDRGSFFRKKRLVIAGRAMSLDDIEHGILRRSQVKWGLGYISRLFPSGVEKKLRVQHRDHRIHFTLNCGAASCPPVAFYEPELLERQFQLAERAYLQTSTFLDTLTNTVQVTALMGWFRGDFGGKRGIRSLLQQYGWELNRSTRIRFAPYNWELELKKYQEE